MARQSSDIIFEMGCTTTSAGQYNNLRVVHCSSTLVTSCCCQKSYRLFCRRNCSNIGSQWASTVGCVAQ